MTHETIYQALYVQGRGELRRELTRALRSGRTRRKPHRQANRRRPRFTTPMLIISERPADAADRAGGRSAGRPSAGSSRAVAAIHTVLTSPTASVMTGIARLPPEILPKRMSSGITSA